MMWAIIATLIVWEITLIVMYVILHKKLDVILDINRDLIAYSQNTQGMIRNLPRRKNDVDDQNRYVVMVGQLYVYVPVSVAGVRIAGVNMELKASLTGATVFYQLEEAEDIAKSFNGKTVNIKLEELENEN